MKKTVASKTFISGLIVILLLLFTGTISFADKLDDVKKAIEKKGAKWTARETSVSQLPLERRKFRVKLRKPTVTGAEELLYVEPPFTGLPATFDWRNYNTQNYVTPIRDQGDCGSCWAFATTGALESYTLIKNNLPGQDADLAEQVLVSCAQVGDCDGGNIDQASTFLQNIGLPVESCYYYTGTNGYCGNACLNWQTNTYRIMYWDYVATTSPSVDLIKNALYTFGPLVTTMEIYEDFYYYSSGVYSYAEGADVGGHAILLIGYNDQEQYFIAKNSWGPGWGEGGYFNIAYSQLDNPVQFGYYTIAYHQKNSCTYSIAQARKSFPAAGGPDKITLITGANCSWTAVSNDSWITITQGTSGMGKGSVRYSLSRNTTPTPRTGTITIGDRQLTVTQKGANR